MPARKPAPVADPLVELGEELAAMPPAVLRRFLDACSPEDLTIAEQALGHLGGADRFFPDARTKQIPPPGGWSIWLLMAGRGWGKTRTGAEWVVEEALTSLGDYAVVAPTAAAGRDICMEGRGQEGKPSGIISVLEHRDRRPVAWNRSLGELRLENGSQIKLLSAEEPERARGWNLRGAWCVAEGELVETESGARPIESIRAGDRVWTRAGLREVLAARCTSDDRDLVELRAAGHRLRCTPDHRVWTDRGWVCAADVIPSDRLRAWNRSSQGHQPGSSGMESAGIATGAIAITETGRAASSTSASGRPSTAGRFRRGTSSTILTRTEATAIPPTSSSCPEAIISDTTTLAGPSPTPNGRAEAQPSFGPTGSPNRAPATSAGRATSRSGCERNGAALSVGRSISGAKVVRLAQRAAVYDLTVDGAHEFFAGGILVHNCDELGSWPRPDAFDQLRFALRVGDHPRLVVTTTPRPTGLIRSLIERAMQGDSVAVTRGSTWENRDNLSGTALAELEDRYGGTRLGRQELEGELLDDIEGALWKRTDIRRAASAPPLARIMVGIDPSTWGSDTGAEHSGVGQGLETGIVVVGVTNEQPARCFVLDDLSGRHSPDEWGKIAVRAQHHWSQTAPTWIVPETNAGGAMVTNTIRSVDPSARIFSQNGKAGVHAAKGKRARAEPVAALYEQGRVLHLGSFEILEAQMCEWDASMPWSPDRVDGLVWAITALKPWSGAASVGKAPQRQPGKPKPGRRAVAGRVGRPQTRGSGRVLGR